MSITSAVALSPDPEMREREIRAMRDSIDDLRKSGTGDAADRIQRRLDALMEGGNGNL